LRLLAGWERRGLLYSYAYPVPAGFSDYKVEPDAAYYDDTFDEFLLPYAAVRTASNPDAELTSFFQSTYEAAATLADWDRSSLESAPPPVRPA
jgi:hypothetical protein